MMELFTKIVNDFSLFPANIHLLSVLHWQFLITYTFSVSLKFRCKHYITGQWGEFTVKNATFYLNIYYWHFIVVFHEKICVYTISFLFFDKVSDLCNRILETGIKPIRNRNRRLEIVSGTIYFISLENTKKHLVFWRFQGVWNGNIDQKWVTGFW